MFKNLFSRSADQAEMNASTSAGAPAETLRISFREVYEGDFTDNVLAVPMPFQGIAMAYPSVDSDPFVRSLLRAEAGQGWGVLLWEDVPSDHARYLQGLAAELKGRGGLPDGAAFRTVSFSPSRRSDRVNPIQCRYIRSVDEAVRVASSFLSIACSTLRIGGDIEKYRTECENLLAAAIHYLVNFDRQPYGAGGERLAAAGMPTGPDGKPCGPVRYIDAGGREQPVHHWTGRCSSFPHVALFLMQDEGSVIDILVSDPDVTFLVQPLKLCCRNRDSRFERVFTALRCVLSRFLTPKTAWVLSGDDFSLDLGDKDRPTFLSMGRPFAGEDGSGTAMGCFLIDRIMAESARRPAFSRPLGVVMTDCPTALAGRLRQWQCRAGQNRVCLAVGLRSLPELADDVSEPVAKFLYRRFGMVVVSAASEASTVRWVDKQLYSMLCDRLSVRSRSRNCVAGVIDDELSGIDCFVERFAGIPDGGEDSGPGGCGDAAVDLLAEREGYVIAGYRANLERIETEIAAMVDACLGVEPAGGQFTGPHSGDGAAGLFCQASEDKIPVNFQELLKEIEADDPCKDAGPAGAPPTVLPTIDGDEFSQLYRRAADDDATREKMEL